MTSVRRAGRAKRVAGALIVSAAVVAPASAPAADPPATNPIRFTELSTLSGGTIDLGTPTSTVEKAACLFFDADGDGWDDFISQTGAGEPDIFLLNRPDGAGGRTFVPAPAGHGLDVGACLERDGASITAGDVDGDGDEDLFVGMGWNAGIGAGKGDNVLLLNDGAGRFTDVSAAAGILDGDNTTAAAFFFDMDRDGDLDLFTCNSSFALSGKEGDGEAHLWRNELAETGSMHFVDELAARGIEQRGFGVWCATGVDFDGDGDGDLLLGHDGPTNTQLFLNDGAGRFTEVTDTIGAGEGDDQFIPSTFGDDSHAAMGIAWGDVENDGDLDVYITNIATNPLYRNNGDGTVTEVGLRSGVRAEYVTWGCNFADFDLDGFVDLYVAGGDLWDLSRTVVHSFLYRNRGTGIFEDVLATAGMRRDVPLHREEGTATSDFDLDGRVDLLVARAERVGASPYVYRNTTETAGRRWLAVRLHGNGTTTNTGAIGARVRIVPKDAFGVAIPGMSQIREVNGGDSRGSRSSLTQSFGLGGTAVLADVVVTWPRQGTLAERTQTYVDVPLDQRVTIAEAPRTIAWRPEPTATATVGDGRLTLVPCAADGAPDPLATLTVETGPEWVAAGAWDGGPDGGRVVAVAPPRVTVAAESVVGLLAVAQGAPDPEMRQTLTIRVVPAPRVDTVKKSARALTLTGDHLDLRGLTATVDGVAYPVRRLASVGPKRARRSRLKVVVPKAVGRSLKTGPHTVEVLDPATGISDVRAF